MKGRSILCRVRRAFLVASVIAASAPLRPLHAADEKAIRVLRRHLDATTVARRSALGEARPPVRGYRVALEGDGQAEWPFETSSAAGEAVARASAWVAERLAFDGLLATLVHAGDKLGDAFTNADRSGRIELLRATGLPVDLCASFRLPAARSSEGEDIVTLVAERLRSHAPLEELLAEVATAEFEFQASRPRFHAATESGEDEIGLVRLQLTRGSYWTGVGDGGSLDLARELVRALPEAQFVASIEEKHADGFLSVARQWPFARADQLTLICEPSPVSQWAQDNGKAGWIEASGDRAGGRTVATLIPRYASRGEDGSIFVPGESFLMEGLRLSGHEVVQSSLLFQGGDLLVVRAPRSDQRWMLMGEAELHRNTALGLSPAQVLAAFRAEFGVDRCVVLPAVSFHIDYELTVRTGPHGERWAFVHDTTAGTSIVLECGIGALERGGVLGASDARELRELLAAGDSAQFLERIGTVLNGRSLAFGKFPESLSNAFSTSVVDSGVGNLQTFLFAVDLLASTTLNVDQLATDPHTAAYLRSLVRRADDRRVLHAGLAELGFELVAVPSLVEEARGIHHLNGLHQRSAYLMPAYQGLYEPLDQAARSAFERLLGPDVKVISIPSAESQRRSGAVHCAASAYPRL